MKRRPLADRFWEKVKVAAPHACWEWQGAKNRHGYGRIAITGENPKGAHRVSYYLAHGRWPEHQACHHCDNPGCVNPAHIYDGTYADNTRDAIERGRSISVRRKEMTHCKRGHLLQPRADGTGRQCRTCSTLRAREAYQADPVARAAYQRQWRAKRKSNPGGVDIVDCERQELDGKVAYLPIAGKVAA